MTLQIKKRLLGVEEYHRMIEADILSEDDRVELINGEIIEMSPIKSFHASHVMRINHFLSNIVGEEVIVNVQNPILIPDYSEPEPDIALLKWDDDFYYEKHPQPEDVILLIEVADSSLEYDQNIKLPLYANAQIPECWIVNLREKQIEMHQYPENGIYKQRVIVQAQDEITIGSLELSFPAQKLFR
ncbi:MAG: Uma2 family endonuclease [Bacteroidota bacterium]